MSMLRYVRIKTATALVLYVSHWIDLSYLCHCQHYRFLEKVAAKVGKRAEKLLLPLALRLDVRATGQAMANEGWWG